MRDIILKLGFKLNTIIETILVTVGKNGSLNAAPMGIEKTEPLKFVIRPYRSSQTYINLKESNIAAINITSDPALFLATAFKDYDLNGFETPSISKDMIVIGSDAVIYVKDIFELSGSIERSEFEADSSSVKILKKVPRAFSRGWAESIEAIIHATRIKVFLEDNQYEHAEKLYNKFIVSKEVVSRVSPHRSPEYRAITVLEELIKSWRNKT